MYSSWNAFHYKPLTFNISCSIPSSEKRGFSLSLLFNFVVDCVHRSHSNQARLSKDEPTWLERTQLAWWRLSCIGFTKLLHFHVQALKTFTSVRSTKLKFKELFNSKIPISDFKVNNSSHFNILDLNKNANFSILGYQKKYWNESVPRPFGSRLG